MNLPNKASDQPAIDPTTYISPREIAGAISHYERKVGRLEAARSEAADADVARLDAEIGLRHEQIRLLHAHPSNRPI